MAGLTWKLDSNGELDIASSSLFLMQWFKRHGTSPLWDLASRAIEELADARVTRAAARQLQLQTGEQLQLQVESQRVETVGDTTPSTRPVPDAACRSRYYVRWESTLHDVLDSARRVVATTGVPSEVCQPAPDGWRLTHLLTPGDSANPVSGLWPVKVEVVE